MNSLLNSEIIKILFYGSPIEIIIKGSLYLIIIFFIGKFIIKKPSKKNNIGNNNNNLFQDTKNSQININSKVSKGDNNGKK